MADLRTAPPPQRPAPPPYRRSRGPLIALVVLVIIGAAAAVFLVVAAGDDGAPRQSVTTPSAPTTAGPTTTLDREAATRAEIEAAYRQSWDAFIAVGSDPNGKVDDPRLQQHMVGNALLAAQVSIQRLRNAGHVYQGTVEVHPSVVQLTPETAVVQDCGIDRLSVVDQRTGEVVTPAGPPEGNLATASYRLIDGVWMQNEFKDEWRPCEPPES